VAYTSDMKAAARRLSTAAEQLHAQPNHRAVAAYLIGLAAECALKFVASSLPGGNSEAIQGEHLPRLRTALRELQLGRRQQALKRLIDSDAFMNEWKIDIRYARNQDIHNKPTDRWRTDAVSAVNLMEGWA